MKKLAILLVMLTQVVATGFSQQYGGSNVTSNAASLKSEKGDGKITGIVTDAENNQPIEFATVALMKAGTETPVDGTVCDDKGKFDLHNVALGSYKVVISFIGYETQTIDNIQVTEKNKNVNLGTIKLTSGTKILNEVVVEGQKSVIEERVDRTIYNAENDQTAKGGDATDVLKRVPMLSVDLDGNVSMRGSSNIQVLINNKPSTIMASSIADALKQIPADQIKTVEVITSPSAKYDAEGSGGIINIITKKNTLEGLTLNIDAGVGLRGSNLGLNGNYRKKKMGFSLGGWGRANYNVNGEYTNTQTTYSDFEQLELGNSSVNTQHADTRSQGLFGHYTLGWDYDINDKNFITASVRFGTRNNKSYQDNLYTSIEDMDGTRTSLQDVETKNYSNSIDANLTFTHLYEKPSRELSFLAGYSRNNQDNNFDRLTREIDEVITPAGTININNSTNEELTFQVDYQTPISTNQILEIGGKNIFRKVFSDYAYYTDEDGDGNYDFVGDGSFSNNLNYNQNVTSGYLSYTFSTNNGYSFKAGSRYEYTTIDAYTLTEDNIDIPSYGALVPSLNISRKLKNGKTVKAAYNRRIQRPSIRFLNPNIQSSNPYDITYGNPSLDPEYTNNYELSYSTFVKGTSLNFSGFWRNTNNGIQEVRSVIGNVKTDADTVSTTYRNIGQEDAVGMNVFANINIGKLMLNGGTDFYYVMLDNNIPIVDEESAQSSASNEGWVVSYRLFGSYNLTKGWGFQFFGFYRGRQVQLQGTQGGFGIYSVGLRKEFNNKKGSIGFGIENFLTKEFKIKNELNSPLVQRDGLTTMRNSSIRATFSYRIGKMSVDAKPKRKRSINNDDLKDGGDGGGMDSGGGMSGGGGSQRGGGTTGGFTGSQRTGAAATTAVAATASKSDSAAVVKPEGKWSYTIDSPQGGDGTLTITKAGDTYSGTIFNARFNSETKLTEVKVNGNEMSFTYDVSRGGNTMTIVVNGIIAGDTYNGNMAVGQFGTFPIQAKRVE